MATIESTSQRLANFLSHHAMPVLDVRNNEAFELCHFKESVNIPFQTLTDRLYELPKTSQPLRLIADPIEIIEAEALLRSKGFKTLESIAFNAEIIQALSGRKLLTAGKHQGFLWSPAPMVHYFQTQIASGKIRLPSTQPTALDIGCGSGRDAVYLAINEWKVLAIDYLDRLLQKCNTLANRYDVEVNTLRLDLEGQINDFASIKQQFDLVQVIRYLHRPLLPLLIEKIKPGGYLLYQTFSQGCEAFGKPKNPRFILKQNELAEYFKAFNIIVDKIEYLEDGRPTNVFLAQKRLSKISRNPN